jgi:probable selenium-dependent hydroxylase accessory protein YqeC
VQAARSPYAADPVKLVGLKAGTLDELAQRLPGVTWLVEADGAKGRFLKAPAEHEPVIPPGADRVVVVAGLGAIGEPLDEQTVHRPEIAARLLGVPLGTLVTPDLFAQLLGHASGGLKRIPSRAEVVALLTQQHNTPHPHAETVARQLLYNRRISHTILANLRPPTPILETWKT